LLLAGSYAEKCAQRTAEYDPFTMGFHPPSLTHSDEVGSCGSRMFCVELRDAYLLQTRPFLTAPQFVPDLCASDVTWLGLRLYRSFASETLSALELEELCGDMLERVSGSKLSEETARPAWLNRSLELLHESFRESLTLEEIAARVGVHPIHLSRVFENTMAAPWRNSRTACACNMHAGPWRRAGQISRLLQARLALRIRATWVAFSNPAPDKRRENSAAFSIRNLLCSKS